MSSNLMGLSDAQALAVAAVLAIASPELRGGIEVAIGTGLGPTVVGSPYADSAVLSAIGAALVRYSEAT
jgi:hypothetical protein